MSSNMNINFIHSFCIKKYSIFLLIIVSIIAIYMLGFRGFLQKTASTAKIELPFIGIMFLSLALFLIALIVVSIITLVICLFFKSGHDLTPWILRLKCLGGWTITLTLSFFITCLISQKICYTPPILDSEGNIMEGSIAELKQIDVNGSKQWITIRGDSTDKPVLLFLAGGPGGSQLAATRIELRELEKHFIVVNWDQPGSGKSFNAISKKDLTVQRYVNDGVEITKYLRNRFDKDKIYVVGESWGSALGLLLGKENPELYYAIMGTGQMISFLDTEKVDYGLAKKLANENGDIDLVKKLDKQGSPPYYGKNLALKSSSYLMYLGKQMSKNPEISNSGYNTFGEVGGPEYGIYDKINYFRGIISTFGHVYPQLYNIDFRNDIPQTDVPVYFFIGRHDINAPTHFVEEYYNSATRC